MSTHLNPSGQIKCDIVKYLTFMTEGDLSIATEAGYLDDEREVTPKGYLELTDVARVKVYPKAPKLSALDKLFNK